MPGIKYNIMGSRPGGIPGVQQTVTSETERCDGDEGRRREGVSASGGGINPRIIPRIITALPRARGVEGMPGIKYNVMGSRPDGIPGVQQTLTTEAGRWDGEEGRRREGQDVAAVETEQQEEETEEIWRVQRLERDTFLSKNQELRNEMVCTIYSMTFLFQCLFYFMEHVYICIALSFYLPSVRLLCMAGFSADFKFHMFCVLLHLKIYFNLIHISSSSLLILVFAVFVLGWMHNR
jgi:hypothetical protein